MKKYVIALDQGTTSCRAIAFDINGTIVASENKEFKQYFPQQGYVEHDANEILSVQIEVLKTLTKKYNISPAEIASIGITNQRETVVLWDKTTGIPVYNAIVWQCRRTADICQDIIKNKFDNYIKSNTGLVVDAYFSATKIAWILKNVPHARKLADENKLCAGTIDSWLIYNLTKNSAHKTDISNASRTMLFNINTLKWDEEICKMLDIPMNILPVVVNSNSIFGMLKKDILGVEIPIAGAAGDQQAALFGQACFNSGDAKNTYGTGCFLLMNTADKKVFSKNNLLTTIAWSIDDKVSYALEGSIFMGGASIQWLRDEMGLLSTAAESESAALQVEDTNDVYFVPAFVGLGAPYWDMYARGSIHGMTRGTNKNHIIRAVLESIAYQTLDVLKCMEDDSNITLNRLSVDGGASANNFLMQFQADILNREVYRPKNIETTALGAAFLSGLSVGFWDNMDHLKSLSKNGKLYYPKHDNNWIESKYKRWIKAVERSKNWVDIKE